MKSIVVVLTDKEMEIFSIICKTRRTRPNHYLRYVVLDELSDLNLLPQGDLEDSSGVPDGL